MEKYLISRKGYREKKRETRLIFLLSGSNKVFSMSRNENINLKPISERSQENDLFQKTHKYTTYPTLWIVRRTVFWFSFEKVHAIL